MGNNKKLTAKPLNTRLTGCSLVATGLALVMVAMPALADDASTVSLDPITVEGNSLYGMKPTEQTGGYAARAATVGTKTPATLRSIPQSITVVTRDVIEDRNYTTLDELAKGTPGLRVLSNGAGRSSIYARGYEYSSYKVNGLPAPMASKYGTLPNLAAFDRVEILRGPTGLFSSTSEMGGIINLVLKQPTSFFKGHVVGRYGSSNQYYTELDVSGPLFPKKGIRGRLVVAKKSGEGSPEGSEVANSTLYGALEFDLAPETELFVGLLRQSRDIVPNNGVPTGTDGELVDYSESQFFGAAWNNFEMTSYDFVADLTHDFDNGGHGRVAVRYSDRNGHYNYIFSGGPLGNGVRVKGLGGVYDQTSLSVDANYSQTFLALGNVGEYVFGVDYKNYETNAAEARFKGPKIAPDEFYTFRYVDILSQASGGTPEHSELESYGMYGKLTIRPLASLALIAGTRISAYEVHYGDESRDDSFRVTPYAGMVFDLNAHHSLYASYSQVFKPQSKIGPDGELLEPREGSQYELGIKGSYFAGALNARLTLFHLKDENAGVATKRGGPYIPIAEREVQGVEAAVSGSPTSHWDLIFGYTYLDTEIKTPGKNGRQEGIFLLMPEHRANLWAVYNFTQGNLNGLRIGAGIKVVSEFKSSRGIEAPGYVVVDAMVGYEFTDQLSGQLNVNNLLNNEYYTRVGSKALFNMRGEPVNFMASLRYDF